MTRLWIGRRLAAATLGTFLTAGFRLVEVLEVFKVFIATCYRYRTTPAGPMKAILIESWRYTTDHIRRTTVGVYTKKHE